MSGPDIQETDWYGAKDAGFTIYLPQAHYYMLPALLLTVVFYSSFTAKDVG